MLPRLSSLLAFGALLASQLQPVLAVDFEERCTNMAFCMTSFVWCDGQSNDGNCVYPDHVYPYNEGNSGMAALIWRQEYNLTWAKADPKFPVLVRWRAHAAGENAPHFTQYPYQPQSDFTNGETSFAFKFIDLAREIEDKSIYEVQGIASELANFISIRQPERFPGEDVHDISGQFSVLDASAVNFIDTQRTIAAHDESKKWSRNVSIGVGIGVPVAMAVAGALGVMLGKRIGRKTALGNGFIKMTSSGVE
ncbi:hypothetical protein HJFPF1_09874 [Paramyrothecium foliicola]|nr:hypothetical protein HJFPF1_09874 [Paramyrothecium foliicola]